MIALRNLEKYFQTGPVKTFVLRQITLDIEEGDFITIMGPSGSGKTTLLNLIGCLDVPSSGEITIDGEPVSGKSRVELATLRRHKLGFVFQTFNLIPVLSAYENVSFALSLLGVEGAELRRRTLKELEEVGLQGLEKRKPGELSGGQQQRVAIARALVKEPQIVLADEPTANLDSGTGREILRLMAALNRAHRTTFLFSTHDPMVMDFARRLVLLHDGSITQDQGRAG
jgi:putative ABC transport system ATP-binding protein